MKWTESCISVVCALATGWCQHILCIMATVPQLSRLSEPPAKLLTKNSFLYGIGRVSSQGVLP